MKLPIKIKNLYCQISDSFALKNLTFSIQPNKITAIVGHNGSGKSTLAQILSARIKMDKGSIQYDTIDLNSQSSNTTVKNIKKTVSLCNQFNVLEKNDLIIDAIKNHLEYNKIFNVTDSQIEEKIKIFNLTEHLQKPLKQLSGGNLKKVSIIASLLQLKNDGILILDEPTASLDRTIISKIWNELLEMHKKNPEITIILVSHYADEIFTLANELHLLVNGIYKQTKKVKDFKDVKELDQFLLQATDSNNK